MQKFPWFSIRRHSSGLRPSSLTWIMRVNSCNFHTVHSWLYQFEVVFAELRLFTLAFTNKNTVVQFHNQDPRYFLQHQIYLCYLTLWYNCKIQNIWPKLREQNKKKENLKYCYYSNLQRKLDYPLKDQIDGYFIWLMHFSWNEPSKNWLLDQQLTFICQ